MFRGAIGIIETVGQVGSIEAADAMAKCADVELLGREDVGGGLHAVCVRGDVGSVRASIEAGVRAAESAGQVVGALLIPRPHDELGTVLDGFGGAHAIARSFTAQRPISLNLISLEQLDALNVHDLRALARSRSDFPLKGREISRANRTQLLEELRKLLGDDAAEEGS